MSMPANLVLVRHGESEGNIAIARSKMGDHGAYTDEFKNRHSSLWRLSLKGRKQAAMTGEWMHDELGLTFDRHYTSAYLRAMETAGLLDIERAMWYTDFNLRERDWGELDRVSVEERDKSFSDAMEKREIDSFYWTPPNGESLAQLCLRIDRVFQTLHRECSGKNVLIVCHGEVMWAARVILERLSQPRFHELDKSKNPKDRMHNCQVLHYTRIDPDRSDGTLGPYLNRMRSICPWDMKRSRNEWQQIVRPSYSNQQLMELVDKHPPIVQ